MNEKISIYVATHRKFAMSKHLDRNIFIPILCGKALYDPQKDDRSNNPGMILPELGDNTGDNISDRNRRYSELTGMYWIWKNDKDSDIIGLNHYRRYFADNTNVDFIDRETILENLSKYDAMILGHDSDFEMCYNPDFSIYMGYKSAHNGKDFENALIACKELFPDIYDAYYYEMMNSTAACMCNVIICRREIFMKYCEFLFPILFEVEKKIDWDSDFYKDEYQIRALGFLSERMLRAWLVVNRYTFKDQKILSFDQYWT